MISEQVKPKTVIRFLWNMRRVAPLSSMAMIVAQILFILVSNIVAPIFVAKLLALISSGHINWSSASHLLILYGSALIFSDVIMARLALGFIYISETKMQASLYRQIFDNITSKDLRFHSDNMSGEVISNSTKLVGALENFWDLLVFSITPIITTFIAVTVALGFIFWQYAIVVAVLSIVFSIIISRGQNTIAPVSRQVAKRSSKITGHFADVVTNIAAVKAFAHEKHEDALHDHTIDTWQKTQYKEGWQVFKVTSLFSVVTTLLNIVAFVVAIMAAQNNLANIATIYLVVSYTLSIVEQLWTINRVTRNYVRIVGNAAPMIAMLEAPVTITDDENPEDVRMSRGGIQFRDVKFRYPDNKQEVLFENLNLSIKPGEKIGLVGKSGGGKTTLSKLLLRFMDISDGQILIDGQDIRRVRQSDLRSQIAYVPQEPLLFHRSITDNIKYGQASSTQQEIEAVAKMAHVDEFVAALPKGYDTLVGERGVKLSGGQRQRIAIARAMLKNAPILLLDEATSALDSESEDLIQDALWKLMEGRTAIVIAHRLSTIQQMDRIIVLDDGKIAEIGGHNELINQNGIYADLWNRQSGGFIEG